MVGDINGGCTLFDIRKPAGETVLRSVPPQYILQIFSSFPSLHSKCPFRLVCTLTTVSVSLCMCEFSSSPVEQPPSRIPCTCSMVQR